MKLMTSSESEPKAATDSCSLTNDRRVQRMYQSVVPLNYPNKKRKHGENGSSPSHPKVKGTDGLVSVGGRTDGGPRMSVCSNFGKILRAVQCPTNSAKRIRGINKQELRFLEIQMAMISDEDGDRPIHVAVVHEDLKLVQRLCSLMLKAAISVDLTNFLRQTPLHLAVILGNTELVKLLLKYGASLLVKDRNGNSVIHLAVKSSVSKEVHDVLLSHPQAKTIINSMDHEGYTALHHAVFKNNSEAIRCLHHWGADMNTVDGKSGRTALIHAVLEPSIEMVKLLLNCGACALKDDYSGRSPFELALQSSDVQIIKLLEKQLPLNDLSASKEAFAGSASNYSYYPTSNFLAKRTRKEATRLQQNVK